MLKSQNRPPAAARVIVLALSLCLATGSIPTYALAEVAHELTQVQSQSTTSDKESPASDEADTPTDEATAQEPQAADTGATNNTDTPSKESTDATAAAATEQTSATTAAAPKETSATTPAASSKLAAANDDEDWGDFGADDPDPSAGTGNNSGSSTSTIKLTSSSEVYLQATQDANNSYSKVTDSIVVGTTLWANVYQSSNSVRNPGTWTYEWYVANTATDDTTQYTKIEGQTGQSLVVDDAFAQKYVGKYITVKVTSAADNVSVWGPRSSYYTTPYKMWIPGPVKTAGMVVINTANVSLSQSDAQAGRSAALFTTQNTLWAFAKDKDTRAVADPNLLNYQWQQSDTKQDADFKNINGETNQSLNLANYEGKYVRCVVTSKIGGSTYTTSARNPVAKPGSINISKISVTPSAPVNPGQTLTATVTGAEVGGSASDVTNSDKITYQWYTTDSQYDTTNGTPLTGATTNTLLVTEDMVGKYIYVTANGGFGASAQKVGLVKKAGAVTLDHVNVTGTAKIGQTLTASAYQSYYTEVDSTAVVSYQWQYSTKKSTSNSDFIDIAGATQKTYTIPQTLPDGTKTTGLYLRVKATSDNTVYSTKESYYSPTYPAGPVTLEGGYDISAVELASSGVAAQVGDVLTPQAKVRNDGSYYDTDAPADAKLTYTWYASNADGTNQTTITTGIDSTGKLTLTQDLVGKKVWVEASALMKAATSSKIEVTEKGAYALTRVNLTHDGDVALVGDSISARAFASTITGGTTEVTSKEGVTFSWYAVTSKDSASEAGTLLGTGTTLTIPASAQGKYIKVVTTSKSSTVSSIFESAVQDKESAAGYVARLSNANWSPKLVFDETPNINELLKQELTSLGLDTKGVEVKVTSVSFGSGYNDNFSVGISSADDATNGNVTFLSYDPDKVNSWDVTTAAQANVTFSITKNGSSAEYTAKTVKVPWDEDKLYEYFETLAQKVTLSYATGDTEYAVTQNFTVPLKASKGVEISWESSDTSVLKFNGNLWGSTDTAKITRPALDTTVKITATLKGMPNYGFNDDATTTRTFELVVKGDPAQAEAAKQKLQEVANNFDYTNTTYSGGNAIPANGTDITSDLQLPTTRTLNIDGKAYPVVYTSDSEWITINGYRAQVTRPLPPAESQGAGAGVAPTSLATAADGSVTASITLHIYNGRIDKDTLGPELATKTLSFTVKPFAASEIDDALSLMSQAKAGYKAALLNGTTEPFAGAPASQWRLNTFYGAYLDADGKLVWARTGSAMTGHEGVTLQDFPEYSSMGSYDQARTFKSSDKTVVLNETLQLAWHADNSTMLSQYHDQPYFNTPVTISSILTDTRFTTLATKYKDDPTWGEKLSALVNQEVAATIKTAGTSGQDAPVPQMKVGVTVIGRTDAGQPEVWSQNAALSVDENANAQVASEALFKEAGLVVGASNTQYGYYLSDITSPTSGKKFGYDSATGRYWQLFINGVPSSHAADGVTLKAGDSVVWYYSAYGDNLPTDAQKQVTASVKVVGPGIGGTNVAWVSLTQKDMKAGSTAVDLTRAVLEAHGMTCDDNMGTITAKTGTLPNGATSLGTVQKSANVWAYWSFFINGKYANVMAKDYVLKAGDVIEWVYDDGTGNTNKPSDIELDSKTSHKEVDAEWSSFRGNNAAGTTTSQTPTSYANLAWMQKLVGTVSMMNSISEPILVNKKIYIAVGQVLQVRNQQTGALEKTIALKGQVGATTRLTYADGLILVPQTNGVLQAISVETGKTLWVTDALPSLKVAGSDFIQNNYGTLLVQDGYVVMGTVAASFTGESLGGTLLSFNLKNGALRFSTTNAASGYWWNGAAAVTGGLLVIDNNGKAQVIDPNTGAVISSLQLASGVRANVAVTGDKKTAYVTGYDGVLYKLAVSDTGVLSLAGKVKFAEKSTSSPTLVDGTIYVGGGNTTGGSAGVIAAIDAASMTLTAQVTKLTDGAAIPGEVKASPLVSVQNGKTYVYVTANNKPGAAYVWQSSSATADYLYLPEQAQQNYGLYSLVAADDGSLYYINDSGYLFKLKGKGIKPTPKPAEPKPTPQPTPAPTPVPTPTPTSEPPAPASGSGVGSKSAGASNSLPKLNSTIVGGGKTGTAGDTSSVSAEDTSSQSASVGTTSSSQNKPEKTSTTNTAKDTSSAAIPVWPFVGLGAGIAALAGIFGFNAHKNKKVKEEDRQ